MFLEGIWTSKNTPTLQQTLGAALRQAAPRAKRAEGLKAGEMSILLPLFVLLTLGYMGLMVYDSVAGSAFDIPAGVMAVYIAFATGYFIGNEIRRWTGRPRPPEITPFFLCLWVFFFLGIAVFVSFNPSFQTPADLLNTAMMAVFIYLGSNASRLSYESKVRRDN